MKQKLNLLNGDNIELLKQLEDNSVDSVVTDPPYGLSFMGKKWDYDVPSTQFWTEVYRVLKPGGHVLSFGGTRTYHRMVVNMEDAGFEIRDQIMWLYGSGFPKSHNIGKAVDKVEGNEREFIRKQTNIAVRSDTLIGDRTDSGAGMYSGTKKEIAVTKGTSEWEGWGTALKPANEPICVARKPLSEKTIVANVLKWGTGGINIDGCRVGFTNEADKNNTLNAKYTTDKDSNQSNDWGTKQIGNVSKEEGRFPANIILDEEAGRVLDEQSGISKSTARIGNPKGKKFGGGDMSEDVIGKWYGDKGGASRFFYCPKVSKKERNAGCDEATKSNHPTMKPIDLMAYLCRLVTPKGGTVLDPFMGSGSTGIAAKKEGFSFVGMEMDENYFEIAKARINNN